MKDKAIVGNIGHFDNEIEMAALERMPGVRRENVKPQYDEWIFPDGHSVMILAEGRLLNLGCATGHPSFVMSASFTNQVIAQIELARNRDSYEKKVYVLPKILDEKVARLHLDKLGARLTELSAEQADYIGVICPPKTRPSPVLESGRGQDTKGEGTMAAPKRLSPAQIINRLRKAEVALANGNTTKVVCRELGVSEQTYYRWRREYGGMKLSQAKRLKELEKENQQLKRAVAELTLDKLILKEASEGNF